MQNERENLNQPLTTVEYDISGNVFCAYYDADNKLVFVVDYVLSETKPNALLVINPVGNRKWDDILMNDYGVDLETVRPKKDNKYQKLDIEYTGLAEYDNLIRAFQSGADLSQALSDLTRFRDMASRRAALERLGAADLTVTRARETIEKTNETISELQAKLKLLRSKLATQRKEIGREPTKQTAAKILRTESQIDAVNDKLGRAKKRLQKAQKRLDVAEDDAIVAQNILDALDERYETSTDVAMPAVTEVTTVETAGMPMVNVSKATEITTETKAEDMADDEDVKPLFDKDPKILDENIAFKPVEFGVSEVAPMVSADVMPIAVQPIVDVPNVPVIEEDYTETEDFEPLSFAPPISPNVSEVDSTPVLDTLTAVESPVEKIDSELLPMIEPVAVPALEPEVAYAPVVDEPVVRPLEQPAPQGQIASMSEIEDAPIDTGMRPVSPITGADATATVAPVVAGGEGPRKPAALYYLFLIILIVLSIFTLWIYQRSANDSLPVLTTAAGEKVNAIQETVVEEVPVEQVADVGVVSEDVVEVKTESLPEPVVVTPEVEPEPVPVVEPEPVQVAQDVVPTVVPVTPEVPEPVVEVVEEKSPFLMDEESQPVKRSTEEEIMAKKPAYNVSQNEKMFVADEEYETEDMVAKEDIFVDDDYEAVDVTMDAPIIRPQSQVVNESLPQAEHQLVTQEVFAETEEIDTCADGNAPDADGCCAGEELTDVDGEYMCCAIGTDDCFPPML